jgi:chromosome segregation protein
MKVTRLRLHGFKSFADAIDIPIQPGVTGVVGPNGCGKSNIVDALRFVMGESSYKSMRGGGMEDVIFSGSGGRPSRNAAEVTLLAERDEGTGRGPEALEISRRIERDLGSSYRINGREARARDVQLVFADASTGAHSSALVRQGQVAELIAAKPEKRRAILEDAAGISGLHQRRHEAEQKLKAAEQNLERLRDVMAEIETRLDDLKRQARQAVRYRKISGEIRKFEAVLYVINWETALARLAEAQAELVDAETQFAAATAAQAGAQRAEAEAAGRLPPLRDRVNTASGALDRARAAVAALDREEMQLKARRQELIARRYQAGADLQHESEIGHDAQAAAERLDAEEQDLRRATESAAERIGSARSAAEEAARTVAACEAEFTAAAGAVAATGAERAARERTIREAQAKIRRLDEERIAALRERDRLAAEHGADASLSEATAAAGDIELLLAEREREAEAAEAALATARETERRARDPHDAAERAFGALDAEARTLSELLDAEGTAQFPPLIDSLKATPGFEKALAAALGDDLDAPLDAPDAPAFWGPSAPGEADLPLPAGAEPLVGLVEGPANLTRRLRQVGVVATELGAALHAGLAAGQRLVTREGQLWRWDGFTAKPGSAASGARRLEQRARLAVVTEELKALRVTVDESLDILGSASRVRADAERLTADARRAVQEARETADIRRKALSEAERRHGQVAERLTAQTSTLARIEADVETWRAELSAAEAAIAGLADMGELARKRDDVQADLNDARGRAAETRLDAERAAHEETMRERRLADIATERERWASRIRRAEQHTAELKERLAALDIEIAGVPDDPEIFADRRRVLSSEVDVAQAAVAAADADLTAAEAAHASAQESQRASLDGLAEARETRAREEERVIAAAARKTELAAQIAEHFDCPLDELRALSEIEPDAELPDGAAAEARLHKLKAERERLGGVNLRAEEESNELETRLGEMRSETEDLEEAIKRLRQGIQNLNREGRQRLLAAFETVNGHFTSLFQHLFGGGTANLSLVGAEDPLEAGLEIIARPPGKRPQVMTLLSGGEQALTALALIFAVFLTNPSPICVLDEVDAPLDDANVERFCALLDDMRRRTDTRFVVVTHNPITMAKMDRLYGVTMAERGVSQVVSVDLNVAQQYREAS